MKPQQQGNLRTVSITVVSRYHSTHSALGANSHHAVPWCDAAVYRTDVLSLLLCVCRSFNIWMFSSRYENTKWLILCLGSAAWARYWQTGNPWTALTLILFCDSYFNWFSNISVLSCIRKRTIDVLYCWQSTLIGFIFFYSANALFDEVAKIVWNAKVFGGSILYWCIYWNKSL